MFGEVWWGQSFTTDFRTILKPGLVRGVWLWSFLPYITGWNSNWSSSTSGTLVVIKKGRVSRPYDISSHSDLFATFWPKRNEKNKNKNKTKQKTEVIMEEVDTHFQDQNNLLLHTEALQAPSSNQLLLGLAWVLFLLRPKTNKRKLLRKLVNF